MRYLVTLGRRPSVAGGAQPRLYPWQDRRGVFSPLKAIVFTGVFLPGLWLVARFFLGTLGPRPWIEANHQAGLWAIRFLLLTLAVTPLRHVWRWPELVFVRRSLGVAVFFYAAIHLSTYAGDLKWDFGEVASEIVARVYLTIGFMALTMLTPLAITSTNGMMRRMGGINWRRLHILVYPILGLATVHFFIQSKLGVTEPIVVAALGAWLMLWRLFAARLGEARVGSLPGTVALAAAVVVGTAFGEALYYHWKVGVAIGRVLPTNFMWKAGTRPAWVVLAIAAAVIVVAACRAIRAARKPRPQRGASGRNPRSPAPQPQGKAA